MSRQFPVLRGLATIFVLINHSISMCFWMAQKFSYPLPAPFENTILTAVREIGIIAVPLFLFLSGAFLSFAMKDRPIWDSYRIMRVNLIGLLSPYLIWSLVFYLVNFIFFQVQINLWELIKNLLVGYPNYFVPLLVFFYVVSPIMQRIVKRQPVILLAAALVYQIFLANYLNPAYFGFQFPSWAHFFVVPVIRSQFALWGVFFPMGMVYYCYMKKINAVIQKYTLLIAGVSIGLFILDILSVLNLQPNIPLAGLFCPMVAILLIPSIKREKIWGYHWLEKIGRNSYGYYLMNLIVLSVSLFFIDDFFPRLLREYLLLAPLLFMLVIFIPMGLMKLFERPRLRVVSAYIFG